MKNKIYKIMGVALALVLVFTLGVAFMPANTPEAEAGTLGWSTIGIPTGTGSVLVGGAEDLGPVAISPDFANDNTVWASVVNYSANQTPIVYKSTNGGHTWTPTTSTLGATVTTGDFIVELKPSPNYATDSTIFVVTQTPGGGATTGRVYRSTNGGSSFGQLGVVALADNEVITCMDVAPNYDGTGTLVVGTADVDTPDVPAAVGTCVQIWGSNNILSWQGLSSSLATPADVTAIIYSPNFAMDSTILTVSSDNAGSMDTKDPHLRAIVGGVWDSGIAATCVNTDDPDVLFDYTNTAHRDTTIWAADIAVPSDYNGQIATSRRAYVSIVSNRSSADEGNIYRITNVTPGTAIATAAGILLHPIEYRGTFAEGTLLGCLWGADEATASDVYRTTNPTSSVVNWYEVAGAANKPTGTATANTTGWLAASTDYVNDSTVVVGTVGDDSAFGISTNGAVSFNETGLIDNSNTAGWTGTELDLTITSDLTLSPAYGSDGVLYLVTENDSNSDNDTNVWVRTADGLWERCFTANFAGDDAGGNGVIACSDEFETDSVLYVGDTGQTAIYYSANAGQSWSARAVAAALGIVIQTVAAPDATTVYVGEADGTGRIGKSTNSGWTWPTALRKATGCTNSVMSLKVDGSTLVAGGNNGSVRRSDDGGATWSKVAATVALDQNIYVDFDDTYVYAGDGDTGAIWRSEDGGSWRQIGTAFTTAADDCIELILADDGTLYYAEAVGQEVRRSVDPHAPLPTPDVTFQAFANTPEENILAMSVVSSSSNEIAICNAAAGIRIYSDTLSLGTVGPTLASPADGSVLARGTGTRFGIAEHITNVTAYAVWWSTDSTFTSAVNVVEDGIAAPSLQTRVEIDITEGATVYWRARATTPLNSPWSEVWSFETELITEVRAPVPAYPALDDVMNVPIEPIFNWGSFKYATGYEFQLAKDPGLTDFVADLSGADALGNITSWKCTTTLAYNSTYYWRVRAVIGTSATYSDWSAIVGFTTMSKPVAPAPPVIIEPTPAPAEAPAPITPAYIYAIIAIGAVLVIVVIVLIVRTRRVP